MALSSGSRLGPYEILAPLGAGGMGEVYRARDTRLGRDVAVKVLPQHLAATPEARARFEREARTISSLNHPHICTLHDVGREGATDYLVMELVEGESLADRIARGPLPPPEALRIGAQIADALDRAHRAGVVHRDLKPGNVMLARSGAKLMDFGLARPADLGAAAGLSALPTVASPLTAEGAIVGTFQYMAPEQLEGREADARTDVWALGALLYEMVTGKRAFQGASPASLISAIMKDEPRPLVELAPLSPPALDRVVRSCLAKDPDGRWQRAHDVRLVLESFQDPGASGVTVGAPATVPAFTRLQRHPGLVLAAGVALGLAAGFGLATRLRPVAVATLAQVRTITQSGADQTPACSADGRMIAFASARTGVSRIWLKQLASGDEVALTDGEDGLPRFSPDGTQILFTRIDGPRLSLWRVPIVGGQARRLVDDAIEGDWSPDGTRLAFLRIGFAGDSLWSEAWIANGDGSEPRRITRLDFVTLGWLSWSPDGRTLLAGNIPRAGARIEYSLISTDGTIRTVVPDAGLSRTSNPVWLGSGDAIAYAVAESRATTITGQSSRLLVHSLGTGRAREVLSLPTTCDWIAVLGTGRLVLGAGQFGQNLLLVENPGTPASRERWLTRGASMDRQPVFSRDGARVLFSSNRAGNLDLWEVALDGGSITRLTDDPAQDWDPCLTPDGTGVLWSSDRGGNFEIWGARADGSAARQISHDGEDAENPSVTPDGGTILYLSGGRDSSGIWVMRADGTGARPLVLSGITLPELSPGGTLISAVTGTSGATGGIRLYRAADGVHVADIPPAVVSPAGMGNAPNIAVGRNRWIGDGRLAYVDVDEQGRYGVTVRDVSAGAVGPPRALAGFHHGMPTESFGVTPDGSRIVLSVRSANQTLMLAEHVSGIEPPVAPGRGR